MGRRIGVLAGLAVCTASACSATPGSTSTGALALESTTPLVVAGTCLAGERLGDEPDQLAKAIRDYGLGAYDAMADDPVWTDPVACAEAHLLEVYATVSLPDELDSQISSYADLIEPPGSLSKAINDDISHQCARELEPGSAIMRSAALDVDVVPLVTAAVGRLTWNPAPPSQWNSGERVIGCLFEQPSPGVTKVSDLSDATLPVSQRICLDGARFADCSGPHTVERVASLLVDRAIGAHQLAGVRAVNASLVDLGANQWDALDRICQRYLTAIAGEPAAGLRGVANTYPELYPDASGHFRVVCSAQSRFGTPPADMVVTTTSVYGE